MLDDVKDDPQLYQRLLVDRNRTWLPKIEALFARAGRAFVVVGAAHLVGPDGLLALLRAKGYQVDAALKPVCRTWRASPCSWPAPGSRGLPRRAICRRVGASVTVIDARDRVGGRVWTIRDGFAEASTPKPAAT